MSFREDEWTPRRIDWTCDSLMELACFPPQECEPMVGVILSVCSSIMSGPEMVPGRY